MRLLHACTIPPSFCLAGACDFNGINMTRPRCFYVFSDSAVDEECDGVGEERDGADGLANSVSHPNGSLEQHKLPLPPQEPGQTIKS